VLACAPIVCGAHVGYGRAAGRSGEFLLKLQKQKRYFVVARKCYQKAGRTLAPIVETVLVFRKESGGGSQRQRVGHSWKRRRLREKRLLLTLEESAWILILERHPVCYLHPPRLGKIYTPVAFFRKRMEGNGCKKGTDGSTGQMSPK